MLELIPESALELRWTPHPVIVTIRDNRIRLGSYYSPIILLLQGGGVLLT